MKKLKEIQPKELKDLGVKYEIINNEFYYYENKEHFYLKNEDKNDIYYNIIINGLFYTETNKLLVLKTKTDNHSPRNIIKFIYENSNGNDILYINGKEYEGYIKENNFIIIDTNDNGDYIENIVYTFSENEIYQLNNEYKKQNKNNFTFFQKLKNLFK